MHQAATVQMISPPSLAHFVIFNPSLGRPPPRPRSPHQSRSPFVSDPSKSTEDVEDQAKDDVKGRNEMDSCQSIGAEKSHSSQGESKIEENAGEQQQSRPESERTEKTEANLDQQLESVTQEEEEEEEGRNPDLEDDLREAAQILFYTSREAGGVSRNKMLRQVGLVKGLMSFSDMVIKGYDSNGGAKGQDVGGELDEIPFWSIHSHRSRLLIYAPEPDIYIYVCITLAHDISTPTSATGGGTTAGGGGGGGGSGGAKTKTDPAPTAQGLSDHILIHGLRCGYEDFCLLHSPITQLLPPSPSLSTTLDKFWTRFAFGFENAYLSPSSSDSLLYTWLGGYPRPPRSISNEIEKLVQSFITANGVEGSVGVIGKDGPLFLDDGNAASESDGNRSDDSSSDLALVRYLVNVVRSSIQPPQLPPVVLDSRQSLGLGLGGKKRKDDTLEKSIMETGSGVAAGAGGTNNRKTSWATTLGSAAVGWVPGLGTPTFSRSTTPVPSSSTPKDKRETKREDKSEKDQLESGLDRGTGQETVAQRSDATLSPGQSVGPKTKWPLGLSAISGLSGGLGALGHGLSDAMNLSSVGAALRISSSPKMGTVEQVNKPVVVEGEREVGIEEVEENDQAGVGKSEVIKDSHQELAHVQADEQTQSPIGNELVTDGCTRGEANDIGIQNNFITSPNAMTLDQPDKPPTIETPELQGKTQVVTSSSAQEEIQTDMSTKVAMVESGLSVQSIGKLKEQGQGLERAHGVERTPVAIPELEEAVQMDVVERSLTWGGKNIWIRKNIVEGSEIGSKSRSEQRYQKRHVIWVIRDQILLFIVLPENHQPPYTTPSTSPTLALFSNLSSILSKHDQSLLQSSSQNPSLGPGQGRGQGQSSHHPHSRESTSQHQNTLNVNSSIYHQSRSMGVGFTDVKGPELDKGSGLSLVEMKDYLCRHPDVTEVHARTSKSQFIVAKQTKKDVDQEKEKWECGKAELYMMLGRKEATLTDSDHAVRVFAQDHPEIA